MKHAVFIAGLAIISLSPFQNASAAEYLQDCYLNTKLTKCSVNTGLGRQPLAKGSDIDIYWKGGRLTSIKLLDKNWGPGGKVLINGNTRGHITGSVYRRGSNYMVIRTDNGLRIDFSYGD